MGTAPSTDQIKIKETIGTGFSGTVYSCQQANHALPLALKAFHAVTVNRALHQKMMQRLHSGSWPKGVMPVVSVDYQSRPAVMITADYRNALGQPNNLQFCWDGENTDSSWSWIRGICQALAEMHARQVAHGNLKPSNVFFDDSQEIMLSDWALGNMPGVQHVEFTDAYLYQSPEQLLHSDGYLEEAGYRWDVYSFACLSYLLLTGKFPRCHEIFSSVAPAFGSLELEKIVADTARIAAGLQAQAVIAWPRTAVDEREQELLDLLTNCLDLDPTKRPVNMLEVARRIEAIDLRHETRAHQKKLTDQLQKTQQRARILTLAVTMLFTGSVASTLAWQWAKQRREHDQRQYLQEVSDLRQSTEEAISHKNVAEAQRSKEVDAAVTAQKTAEETLRKERSTWIEQIRASREVGDHLFHWAMTKGHRDLPALDGRAARLQELEGFYQEFVVRSSLLPEIAEERARAQMNLAEISLALGDAAKASERLDVAIKALSKFTHSPAWKLRIATGRLMQSILWQKASDTRAEEGFATTRQALQELDKEEEVDPDRIQQLFAIVDFHEAQIHATKGEESRAAESIMKATKELGRLADVKSDVSFLRSELAHCYLSSASVLEGLGKMSDARETRSIAIKELLQMLKKSPKDFEIRLALASTYAAIAEAAMLRSDVSAAEQSCQQASKLLEELRQEQPSHSLVATRLASQRMIHACLLEDRGEISKALEMVDQGLSLLGQSSPADSLSQFHQARLLWEKGRVLGAMGESASRMEHFQKALDLLLPLSQKDHGDLRANHVLHHMGYLHSDMAHAAQLEKNPSLAKKKFAASLAIWKQLLTQSPQNQEYRELLQWCQKRISEIK